MLTDLPEWHALTTHVQEIKSIHMRQLFAEDKTRHQRYKIQAAGLSFEYANNRITDKSIELLLALADQRQLEQQQQLLFNGGLVNLSEQRPALHTALRNPDLSQLLIDGVDVLPEITHSLQRIFTISEQCRQGQWCGVSGKAITDVVNLGVGGSDLGPKMMTTALASKATPNIRCHFISNIDPHHIEQTIETLNPETTLFIIASKSFTTQETLLNAQLARQWVGEAGLATQFIAVTANPEKAQQFGIPNAHILPFWDWVGGRYSVWSAIGLPIAIALGFDQFQQLLQGAHAMDQHFLQANWQHNMPVIMGLLSVWMINFFHATTRAILPYCEPLRFFPEYIQQLSMESTGKRFTHHHQEVNYATGAIIWGGVGCNAQHAFMQLLHQGTHTIPTDFIMIEKTDAQNQQQHQMLNANCRSQAFVLMHGQTLEEAKAHNPTLTQLSVMPGNQPTNIISLPSLNAHALGALIALYEHKTFVESVIWDINPFDQMGVELGKRLVKASGSEYV